MTTQYNYGTGRRKSAVARVFIKPGKGEIIINNKPIDDFFSRKTGRMIVRQPLELTNNTTSFDIMVNIHGGGESGQAGAVRHGITRALIDYDATLKPVLSKLVWLLVMHEKLKGKKLACVRRGDASNSPNDNSLFSFEYKKPPLVRRLFYFNNLEIDIHLQK